MKEAVRIARTLLESVSDKDLDDGIMSPSFEENPAFGYRRIWTIWYDLRTDGEFRGNPLYVYLKPDGTVLSYHIPELYSLDLMGVFPDSDAIPEEQALEIGRKAIAEKLGVPEDEVSSLKAYYTEIEAGCSRAVDGVMGQHVWLVDCAEQNMFAAIKPDGTLKNVRNR